MQEFLDEALRIDNARFEDFVRSFEETGQHEVANILRGQELQSSSGETTCLVSVVQHC